MKKVEERLAAAEAARNDSLKRLQLLKASSNACETEVKSLEESVVYWRGYHTACVRALDDADAYPASGILEAGHMSVADEYAMFIIANRFPFCWWCGRYGSQRPEGWFGPFLIERAHLVSKPRREDARAVVALCSLCHRIEHGETFVLDGVLPRCSIRTMLWLKRRFDAGRYDRAFLAANCIGRLPTARNPCKQVQAEFRSRQGSYPGE